MITFKKRLKSQLHRNKIVFRIYLIRNHVIPSGGSDIGKSI